ncbi:MAG TPA: N-acetyl-gamma-glutamyl-phosphate reductase [Rhodothermales bacterium]|nr:N-acetyl-gamma-glutamyl-phosphate reductase [Rhodothermales bacterium]
MNDDIRKVALLHGAGYAGGELIGLLLNHPAVSLEVVTSRTLAGEPVWKAHPHLRGATHLSFSAEDADLSGVVDAVLIAAEHGKGAEAVKGLLESGYEGVVVDLSADFRFEDPAAYDTWFKFSHPAPELLGTFQYGSPEMYAPYPAGTRHIANPGCFATGLNLALWPLAKHLSTMQAGVTALTGASGSGTRPKEATHFPTREGNVRAYKVFTHQHLPEVEQHLGPKAKIDFVPVSGPWTRGIWGTAHVITDSKLDLGTVSLWFEEAYGAAPFVRLWPGELPELRWSVNTPFCDLGWIVQETTVVVGFGLDNLLKGAASQAIENLNLLLGLPQTLGLLPAPTALAHFGF